MTDEDSLVDRALEAIAALRKRRLDATAGSQGRSALDTAIEHCHTTEKVLAELTVGLQRDLEVYTSKLYEIDVEEAIPSDVTGRAAVLEFIATRSINDYATFLRQWQGADKPDLPALAYLQKTSEGIVEKVQ